MSPTITIDRLLVSKATRVIGHLELWFGNKQHPVTLGRAPEYDQTNPADVRRHVALIKSLGVHVVMPNTYGPQSPEHTALLWYLPELVTQRIGLIVNIDKGFYQNAANPLQAIKQYMAWLREHCFSLPIYEKFEGKYIVTFFVDPSDDPAMFDQIAAANLDCIILSNDQNKTANTMAWIQSDLAANSTWYMRTFGEKAGLHIPCVFAGFDDTRIVGGKALSRWDNSPARVWPAGGPNAATFKQCWDAFNAANTNGTLFPYVQIATLNDHEEGTAVEPKFDGSGGFLSPLPPPIVTHGEIWMDGKKVGDIAPGPHACTEVKVYSDGTITKRDFAFTI
jgi:hypothetical protein